MSNKEEIKISYDDNKKLIFRYKFSDDFAEQLYEFSKIHQYDERLTYKEAWALWIEENKDLITNETKRLNELGYEGNILEKMFISSRYYFRKKSTEKRKQQSRQCYIRVSQCLLNKMDEHILKILPNGITETMKPSTSFIEFCEKNVDILEEEVKLLLGKGMKEPSEIKDKIKKTYKNRYFIKI
jgi:endo-alpha-1,4-polygalactosaminidase (GH114 family)